MNTFRIFNNYLKLSQEAVQFLQSSLTSQKKIHTPDLLRGAHEFIKAAALITAITHKICPEHIEPKVEILHPEDAPSRVRLYDLYTGIEVLEEGGVSGIDGDNERLVKAILKMVQRVQKLATAGLQDKPTPKATLPN